MKSFLQKENTIAREGYSRWAMIPVALSIHLCIGQIYAFSVFNGPLTMVLGIENSTPEDWTLVQLGWIFSIALFCLGASAALFGKWVERAGPRKAMFVSAICFSSGFIISAMGVFFHRLELLYIGSGLVGGIGLGLGYISPVSTLIKWFPDRPGMATGIAIMGFGGGAMIASPLSVGLMDFFRTSTSTGVGETFICMGLIYLVVMSYGMYWVRIPNKIGTDRRQDDGQELSVSADEAVKTPQFYLLFMVLLLNVSAGIGVLGQASVMIQEMFSVESVGEDRAVGPAYAAGFVGILSLFNMIGRFVWSSLSDYLGRKTTYGIFFSLGTILFLLVPYAGKTGSLWLFIASFCVILSMYGGGFATIPAYLKDKFGTYQVGAIHGRLLLAWSLAAIIGPVIINYMRAYQIDSLGMAPSNAYSTTMYIMAGLLILGFICNYLIKDVDPSHQHAGSTE